MADRFRYYFRVRYGDCDAQKVVFNVRYGEYVDISTLEFLRALGYGEAVATGTLDYSVVKQTLEWKAPARFDQVIEASVGSKHLGSTSFTLLTEFRVAGEEEIITRAETVYVFVDPQTLCKEPLTDAFRAALEKGAAGMVTDHAAYLHGPLRAVIANRDPQRLPVSQFD